MNKLIWWNRASLSLFVFGAIILAIALTLQPMVSDDLYMLWGFQKSSGSVAWLVKEYNELTGRVWIILLTTFVSPYPFLETAYRSLIVMQVALLGALAWYCALGSGAWHRARGNLQSMMIFATLLWFALPDRNETVAWLIGNYAYLLPALFGLAFIAWLERSARSVDGQDSAPLNLTSGLNSFVLGLCAGVSHEQVVATCGIYLMLVIVPFSRRFLLERHSISPRVWIAAAGLAVGAVILVGAPSNLARMTYYAAPSLKEVVERMVLYLSGAYFDMGTGTSGKQVWLGILILLLLFFNLSADRREIVAGLKRGVFWLLISLGSLLAMAPATNFISTRTAFFAVIFLYVAVISSIYRSLTIVPSADMSVTPAVPHRAIQSFAITTIMLTVLGLLVVVESVATLISNASVANEVSRRESIVKVSMQSVSGDDKASIRVPFIATRIAALTYIQHPQHDSEFLYNWGKSIGRPIEHDVSKGAPLPNSLNPLKAIKFRHKD